VTDEQEAQRSRAGAVLAAVAAELVGLAGLALVCAGVYRNWGLGWTLIAAGVPLVCAYLARELGPFAAGRRKS
jgi:hypothetical protein